jgi:hypothetical protein
MDPQPNQQPNPNIYAPKGERHLEPLEPIEMPAVLPTLPTVMAPIGLPQIPDTMPTGAATSSAPSAMPASIGLTADDVDVIEKEWVEVAEQVVHDTADDPHAQEEAVENLQVDYMKKRYGRDIKKS